jgi:membrane protease YdiL (CAAX protease family)
MPVSSEVQSRQRTTAPAVFGLIGALVFGILPISHWLVRGDTVAEMLARETIFWCFALAILLWLTLVEHMPLSSIGFHRPTWKGVLFGFLAALVITVIMILQFAVVMPLLHLSPSAVLTQQQAILKTPFWYRILLVLRAAVVEEILFRGYLIEKIRQLSGNTALAVTVSVLAFTGAHLRGWGRYI